MNPLPVLPRLTNPASGLPADIWLPRIVLVLSALALLLIGFLMVYSTSSIVAISEEEDAVVYLIRQLEYALGGVVFCVVIVKFVSYHHWMGPLIWVFWGATVILLVLTAVFGTEEYGAKRWLFVGPVGLQASEFAKAAFLLMAARILNDFRDGVLELRALFIHILVLILLPMMFLYKMQSDLGTTLICLVGIVAIMWLGEVPLRIMAGVVAAGVVFALFASLFTDYREARMSFLNPWDDGAGGLGSGWQLRNSFYAFAEGGLFGVGPGNSREKFFYLPFADTDFIFAIIGEELGMLGALLVIGLFLAFLWAGLRIARSAPDNLGTIIAGGFTIIIVFQAFLNIACVVGLLPTTGKPLPFISRGGSSIVAILCMLGIILSVSRASGDPDIYEKRRAGLRVIRVQDTPEEGPASRKDAASTSSAPEGQVSWPRRERKAASAGGPAWTQEPAPASPPSPSHRPRRPEPFNPWEPRKGA